MQNIKIKKSFKDEPSNADAAWQSHLVDYQISPRKEMSQKWYFLSEQKPISHLHSLSEICLQKARGHQRQIAFILTKGKHYKRSQMKTKLLEVGIWLKWQHIKALWKKRKKTVSVLVRNRQLDLRRVLFCLITFPLSFYSSMYLYFKWLNYPGPCGENYICFPHVSFLGLGHRRPRCAQTPPPLTLSGSPFFIALFSSSICCKMHKYRAAQVHCEEKKAPGKMFRQLLEYKILMVIILIIVPIPSNRS